MRDLNFEIMKHCRAHRDGSKGTQAARHRSLDQMANQLHELGFQRISGPKGLKEKHVVALVQHWQATGITDATMKNRMSHLRWIAQNAGMPHLVQLDNDGYGIARRQYVTNEDRSVEFSQEKIDALPDPYVRMSAELQREFGLRREEAMKFIPSWADQGDHIRLKDSWTKGGRPREIPVLTESQRDVLERAKALASKYSLIPAERSYIQHVKVFERQMESVGLGNSHGARHGYAQARYETLTGWKAPAAGGFSHRDLRNEQRPIDLEARLKISRELGHEREQITAVYLGR